jgi:hypothetical protein
VVKRGLKFRKLEQTEAAQGFSTPARGTPFQIQNKEDSSWLRLQPKWFVGNELRDSAQ